MNGLGVAALVIGFTSIASSVAPSVARADADIASDGLPDPTARLLRWPLSAAEHPELAPRYSVAKDLAEPGLDWVELCKMGAHKRTVPSVRDQIAYLGAWCAIANRDVDTGLASLQRLASSTVRGLSGAIRVDLANILANDADHATELITKHEIRDVVVIDRLAALMIDMNKLAIAEEINDLAIGVGEKVAGSCERRARRIVMNPDAYRGPGIDRRVLLRGQTCVALEAELGCWLDLGRCGAYFKSVGRTNLAPLLDAHRMMTSGSQYWSEKMARASDNLTAERDLAIVVDVLARIADVPCPHPRRQQGRNLLYRVSYRTDLPATTKLRIETLLEKLPRCAP